jgi:integrase
LARAIRAANEKLEGEGLTALPDGLTLHALRRTFASVLVALGKDARYVMGQMGHTDPTMTLGLYAQPIAEEDRERLRVLVEGADLAVSASSLDLAASDSAAEVEALSAEMAD